MASREWKKINLAEKSEKHFGQQHNPPPRFWSFTMPNAFSHSLLEHSQSAQDMAKRHFLTPMLIWFVTPWRGNDGKCRTQPDQDWGTRIRILLHFNSQHCSTNYQENTVLNIYFDTNFVVGPVPSFTEWITASTPGGSRWWKCLLRPGDKREKKKTNTKREDLLQSFSFAVRHAIIQPWRNPGSGKQDGWGAERKKYVIIFLIINNLVLSLVQLQAGVAMRNLLGFFSCKRRRKRNIQPESFISWAINHSGK